MTATPRRLAANRRRWANPAPIIRVNKRDLTAEEADHIMARFREVVRRRQPVIITPDFEVIR
jgi:hypothetical protein